MKWWVTAFRRNKNLKELISRNNIEHSKVKNHKNITKKGKYSPSSVNDRTQVISSSTSKSQQTNKSYKIFHEVNCSSAYVIYLMECTLCKIQYIGKSETSFNIRLNNHHKDVRKTDAILVCKCLQERNHVFNKLTEFIIIVKLTNTTKSKEILRQRFIE